MTPLLTEQEIDTLYDLHKDFEYERAIEKVVTERAYRKAAELCENEVDTNGTAQDCRDAILKLMEEE